jgi:hypothetical protein
LSKVDLPKTLPAAGFGASTWVENVDRLGFVEIPKELKPVCEICGNGCCPNPEPKILDPEDTLEGVPDARLPKRFLDGLPFPKRPVTEEAPEGRVGAPNRGPAGADAANILVSLFDLYETRNTHRTVVA